MIYIDRTYPSPSANIAAEQLLLEMAEAGQGPDEILRVWEPAQYLVVMGRGGRVIDDVFLEDCRRDQIPVIRRFSGGGTILTGPGCLMYTVVLSLDRSPHLRDIARCHQEVGGKLQQAYRECDQDIELRGHSDLCIKGKKFSGNAMRLGRTHVIYHGTLLVEFDLELIPRYLKLPPRRPEYRDNREHLDFVTNLSVDRQRLTSALCQSFGATPGNIELDESRINHWVSQRYSNDEWNLRL